MEHARSIIFKRTCLFQHVYRHTLRPRPPARGAPAAGMSTADPPPSVTIPPSRTDLGAARFVIDPRAPARGVTAGVHACRGGR
ncbi:hypothetical protein OV203_48880 [Nannocystis sp. ILAH1]|uniref:hypothetical protein n=1 Tax=Nannocystis sp. ILAH1 TaxID=2996789 RepID=UPI002271DBC6|nr:hypothetical protein [Nannocystis sp. ILAH1]MCY0995138.1 hypothetical protein [Nannocystis sp. ILAH1]